MTDSNGCPCCETCGKPETKKVNGKIKDLVVRAKTLLCSRCSNRAYKAQQKANVEKRYDGSQDTLGKFWIQNRASLPEAKIAIYEERDEVVACLVARIKEHMAGSSWSQEHQDDLPAAIREFADEFKLGTVDVGAVVDWKDWKAEPAINPDSVYRNYGFTTAIPYHIANSFLDFVEKRLGITATAPGPYDRICGILRVLDGKPSVTSYFQKCATCKSTTTYENEPGKYRPTEWFCPDCRAAIIAKGHVAFGNIADKRFVETQRDAAARAPIRTHDEWGRQIVSEDRIFGERGPYGK